MKRTLMFAFALLVCVAPIRAQAPEQKQATVAYVRGLQTPEGGFLPAKPSAGQAAKPSLGATNAALRALKYFGGSAKDPEAAARFIDSCFDKTAGGFADQPGGKTGTVTTDVGMLAVFETNLRPGPYADAVLRYMGQNTKTFEEIRMAGAAVEVLGARPRQADQWIIDLRRTQNPDGTFGKGDGQARETGSAVAALLRLGVQLTDDQKRNVLKAIKEGQRKDGAFGEAGKPGSDLGTSYRLVRCLHMLHDKPADVEALRSFIAKCRNDDGGYGVAPGQPSSVSGTYYAGIMLHWLDEK